jgi:acyl-coenzyme A thioesterase PaaI-like protein
MAFSLELLVKTLRLRMLGWARIPLLASVRPSVVALDEAHCVVKVPLRRFTKNHHGSMYFGALAIGADIAAGLLAVELIRQRRAGLSLLFKAFGAEFLKRPEGDVYFTCEDGPAIAALVEKVLATGERQTAPVRVRGDLRTAEGGWETVAEFTLELSLKKSGKAVL